MFKKFGIVFVVIALLIFAMIGSKVYSVNKIKSENGKAYLITIGHGKHQQSYVAKTIVSRDSVGHCITFIDNWDLTQTQCSNSIGVTTF